MLNFICIEKIATMVIIENYFSAWETFNLFIFKHGSMKNIRDNRNYKPPSDDYIHWSDTKVCHCHRPSLVGAAQTLL